jgi:hypothetical protein
LWLTLVIIVSMSMARMSGYSSMLDSNTGEYLNDWYASTVEYCCSVVFLFV